MRQALGWVSFVFAVCLVGGLALADRIGGGGGRIQVAGSSAGGSGTVTSVTGTAPIFVTSGTTTPVISFNSLDAGTMVVTALTATTIAPSGAVTSGVASGSVSYAQVAGARHSFDSPTNSAYVDYDGTNIAFVGKPVSAPSLVLAGSITGATTGAFSGAISSSVASASIAYQSLTGARWSTVTGGANYFVDNGSSLTFVNYTGIVLPTTLDLYFDGGAGISLHGRTGSNGYLELAQGAFRFASATALPTCASGLQGLISRDSAAGSSTGQPTKFCQCVSNGAGSPVYSWQDLATGVLGSTTVCPATAIVDNSGTPGSGTASTTHFRASFAAGAKAATITNTIVKAASTVMCTLETVDATLFYIQAAAPSAGSVVVTGGPANATATTNFSCVVRDY